MRLNFKENFARVGNVDVHGVSKVLELDSGVITGRDKYDTLEDGSLNTVISHLSLLAVEKQLAIIVPCMNEEHFILEGVLRGIPHYCLIILVSNSNGDNFQAECAMLTDICNSSQRHGIVVHQQDSGLARAFAGAGMRHITVTQADMGSQNRTGRITIRNGKGEAMIIGTALAKLADKAFVGFIDADNFIPGAVHEYCKIYAAGLHHALHGPSCTSGRNHQPLVMVRLKWKSKPKIVDGKLLPQESGRCSRVVNEWMNCLLTSITGESQNDIIKTANAGEHAMSTELALRIHFATGYAVEPFQLIDAWKRSGVFPVTPPGTPPQFNGLHEMYGDMKVLENRVKILQIETMNPHIHDFGKGEEHVLKMQAQGLGTIYHSKLMPPELRDRLRKFMLEELIAVVGKDGIPEETCVYPSMQGMNWEILNRALNEWAKTLRSVGGA
ncbi:mannosyl-3-phosphoglycerate synthase [Stagonosporopsis vannaccii]|nr:mannosyl-3-phosphoglycerate synthase [Stagonosporopsis vannaccii]